MRKRRSIADSYFLTVDAVYGHKCVLDAQKGNKLSNGNNFLCSISVWALSRVYIFFLYFLFLSSYFVLPLAACKFICSLFFILKFLIPKYYFTFRHFAINQLTNRKQTECLTVLKMFRQIPVKSDDINTFHKCFFFFFPFLKFFFLFIQFFRIFFSCVGWLIGSI